MSPYRKKELENPEYKALLKCFPFEFELSFNEEFKLKRLSFSLCFHLGKPDFSFSYQPLKLYLLSFVEALKDYFAGKASYLEFPHLLDVPSKSQKVLKLLREIPRGEVIYYEELAKRAGIRSARAIGQILAKNPLPLLYPCHRVISKRGILGFSQGPLLKWLLLYWEKTLPLGVRS